MHHHDVGHDNNAGDRRDVAQEVVVELLVDRLVDRVCGGQDEQRVAVARRAHDRFYAEIAGTAWAVLDHERLAESLVQPLSDHPRMNVIRAAGREGHNDACRPRWIGLRPRDARHRRERGGARGQMQKLSAGKFHYEPPSHFTTRSLRRRAPGTTPGSSARAPWRSLLTANSNLTGCINRHRIWPVLVLG